MNHAADVSEQPSTSPLAKKFIYKEKNKIFQPYRRHIFRLKVRTAAEIRFHDTLD